MGQTLPNGIYLPAEGERNCYDGLEGNWRSLDSLISTVAGKASATHTHGNITNDGKVGTTANLPLITGTGGAVQAGSFGNQANTFCEGNDSRLSDARTPVAHTHTKSDVTDLFNSNFVPSANNSYDLGSSSYQWNNLYAKNYYYNGVAWGLNTYNQWTGNNKFISSNTNFGFKSTTAEAGSLTAASNWIYWQDKNDFQDAYISRDTWSDGSDSLRIAITSKRSNGAPSTTGTEVGCGFRLNIQANGNTSIDPFDSGGTDLGTSTNKWKTLNGINPGALSLPNVNAVTGSSNTQLQDISGDLVQDQYFNCYFTPRMDGWAYIALNCSNATIRSGHSSYTVSVKTARSFVDAKYTQSFTKNENAWLDLQIFIPVTANKEITMELTFTGFSVTKAYVIPCLGNV